MMRTLKLTALMTLALIVGLWWSSCTDVAGPIDEAFAAPFDQTRVTAEVFITPILGAVYVVTDSLTGVTCYVTSRNAAPSCVPLGAWEAVDSTEDDY